VRNFTDVDDKIINRWARRGVTGDAGPVLRPTHLSLCLGVPLCVLQVSPRRRERASSSPPRAKLARPPARPPNPQRKRGRRGPPRAVGALHRRVPRRHARAGLPAADGGAGPCAAWGWVAGRGGLGLREGRARPSWVQPPRRGASGKAAGSTATLTRWVVSALANPWPVKQPVLVGSWLMCFFQRAPAVHPLNPPPHGALKTQPQPPASLPAPPPCPASSSQRPPTSSPKWWPPSRPSYPTATRTRWRGGTCSSTSRPSRGTAGCRGARRCAATGWVGGCCGAASRARFRRPAPVSSAGPRPGFARRALARADGAARRPESPPDAAADARASPRKP
jgi:hypothetical protein